MDCDVAVVGAEPTKAVTVRDIAAGSRPLVVDQLGVGPKAMVQSGMAADPLVAEQIHASLEARAVKPHISSGL